MVSHARDTLTSLDALKLFARSRGPVVVIGMYRPPRRTAVRFTVKRSLVLINRREVMILPLKYVPAGRTTFPFTATGCSNLAGTGVPGASIEEAVRKVDTVRIVPGGIVAPIS
jgi:hypothetical protein